MEKKRITDFTQDELMRYIETQRKNYAFYEYQLIKTNLLDKVKRILDLRDLMKATICIHKKTKRLINKYTKVYNKKSDEGKLLRKQENEENTIIAKYISSVMDLMELVYEILYIENFENDIPNLEKYYKLEMNDMVLVNDVIRELEKYDSFNVTEECILYALNLAIKRYIKCFNNNIKYRDTFDDLFPFIEISIEEN